MKALETERFDIPEPDVSDSGFDTLFFNYNLKMAYFHSLIYINMLIT